MNYDDAKSLGDEAERRVRAELERLKVRFGFVALHSVLIQLGSGNDGPTTQLDHVVVDSFGVVIIETKKRSAHIRGVYTDKTWTACYPGRLNKPFPNPLRQNDQQRGHLYQALERVGAALLIDRIRGWVVFVDADISKIVTDGQAEQRVFDIGQLESAFEARNAFQIQTPLSAVEQRSIVSAIEALNRSGEPDAESAHAGYRQRFNEGRPDAATHQPAAAVSSAHGRSDPRPALRSPAPTTRSGPYPRASQPARGLNYEPRGESRLPQMMALGLVSLAAVGLTLWGVGQLLNGTLGPIGWLFALAFLMAMLGNGSSSRRRGRRRSRSAPPPSAPIETRVLRAAVGMVLAVVLLAAVIGLPSLILRGMAPPLAPAPSSTAVESQPVPDVQLAKQRFLELNPDLYGRLSNVDSPSVGVAGSYTTYQWDAVQQSSSDSVQVKQVSLTLDASGQVVGFSW